MAFSKAKFVAPLAAVLALLLAVVYFTGHDGEGVHTAKADGIGVVVSTATDLNQQTSQRYPTFFATFSGYSDPIDAFAYDAGGNPSGVSGINAGTFLFGDDNVGSLPIGPALPLIGTNLINIPAIPAFPVIPTDTDNAPALVWAACGGRIIDKIEVDGEVVMDVDAAVPWCAPFPASTASTLAPNLRFQITSGNGFIMNKNTGFSLGTNVNCVDDMTARGDLDEDGDADSVIFDNGVLALTPGAEHLPASACDVDHEGGAIGVMVAPSASCVNCVIKVDVSDDDGSISTQRIFGVRTMAAFLLDKDGPISESDNVVHDLGQADASAPILVAYNCRETNNPCGRQASVFIDITGIGTSLTIDDATGTLDNAVHFQITGGGTFIDPVGTALQGCQGQEISVIDGRWYGTIATLIQPVLQPAILGACDFDGAYNGVATAFMVGTTSGGSIVTGQQGAAVPGEAQGPTRSLTIALSGQQIVPLRVVDLVAGRCNPVALTFAPGTPVWQVSDAVTATSGTTAVKGAGAVEAIWKYIPANNVFIGFDPEAPSAPVSDYLTTGEFLEVAHICVKPGVTNAKISMPGVTGP